MLEAEFVMWPSLSGAEISQIQLETTHVNRNGTVDLGDELTQGQFDPLPLTCNSLALG